MMRNRICATAVLLLLSSCVTSQWIDGYTPTQDLAGQRPGSSVLELKDAQLYGGDSLELQIDGQRHVMQMAVYFAEKPMQPFAGVRAASVEYLYCATSFPGGFEGYQRAVDRPRKESMLRSLVDANQGDKHIEVLWVYPPERKDPETAVATAPQPLPPLTQEHLCGMYVFYHSSESVSAQRDSNAEHTNHEKLVLELIRLHGPAQHTTRRGSTLIVLPDGEVQEGPMVGYYERREWCRARDGKLIDRCPYTTVAWFNSYFGFGGVLYVDQTLHTLVRAFGEAMGFDHPIMMMLSRRVEKLSSREAARRARAYVPMPHQGLLTEQLLDEAARARGEERKQPPRSIDGEQFSRQLYEVLLRARRKYTPSAESEYWRGYGDGLIERQYMRAFTLDDTVHDKWVAAVDSEDELWRARSLGYVHGLEGTPNPPQTTGGRCQAFSGFERLKCYLDQHDVEAGADGLLQHRESVH